MKKLLLLVAALTGFAAWAIFSPYQNFQTERFVDFQRGMPTSLIAKELAEQGVIRYAWQFLLVRAIHPSANLQAGEYRFTEPASVWSIFGRIARGDIFYFEFTVTEGSNMFDIAQALQAQNIMPAESFLHAAEDPTLIRDLVPSARNLEGFLFPSTYRLTHATTAEDLCKRMTDTFRREWRRITAASGADPSRIVTLASLVEKETGVAEERPLVASVFSNRLAKGMRMECDPTTIYAALLDHRYRGTIHRSDLASKNPYNTYQNTGLPPGPIANPGAQSLAAALAPAQTNYLFFVAKPEGGSHHFSATMAEHEKAVVSYRHAQKRGSGKATGKEAPRNASTTASRKKS
jgi:UPF0755 protein